MLSGNLSSDYPSLEKLPDRRKRKREKETSETDKEGNEG